MLTRKQVKALVYEWAATLGLEDHRIEIHFIQDKQFQKDHVYGPFKNDEDIVLAFTITGWTRKHHIVTFSTLILKEKKEDVVIHALDEVLHIALSPLSEFTKRNTSMSLEREMIENEEATVTQFKFALVRAFGHKILDRVGDFTG